MGAEPIAAWQVYILQCGDASFYTGIAKNVSRRFEQHVKGQGARYTRGRGPLVLCWQSPSMTHQEALVLERKIKAMSREQKINLTKRGNHDQCC